MNHNLTQKIITKSVTFAVNNTTEAVTKYTKEEVADKIEETVNYQSNDLMELQNALYKLIDDLRGE